MRLSGNQTSMRALCAALRSSISDVPALGAQLGMSKAQTYKAFAQPQVHYVAFCKIASAHGWEPDRNFEGFFRRTRRDVA